MNITVYKGTKTSEGVLTTVTSAALINAGCKSASAQNQSPLEYSHEVKVSTTTGVMEPKYQPYMTEAQLCVVGLIGTTYTKSTQSGFTNTLKAGSAAQQFFLKAKVEATSTKALTC